MIEIRIKQKPEKFEDIGCINRAYDLSTTIALDDEATITEAITAFVEALKIEGYRVNEKNLKEAIDNLVIDYIIEEE